MNAQGVINRTLPIHNCTLTDLAIASSPRGKQKMTAMTARYMKSGGGGRETAITGRL